MKLDFHIFAYFKRECVYKYTIIVFFLNINFTPHVYVNGFILLVNNKKTNIVYSSLIFITRNYNIQNLLTVI